MTHLLSRPGLLGCISHSKEVFREWWVQVNVSRLICQEGIWPFVSNYGNKHTRFRQQGPPCGHGGGNLRLMPLCLLLLSGPREVTSFPRGLWGLHWLIPLVASVSPAAYPAGAQLRVQLLLGWPLESDL